MDQKKEEYSGGKNIPKFSRVEDMTGRGYELLCDSDGWPGLLFFNGYIVSVRVKR